MGKLYLKKAPEKIEGSCHGCYLLEKFGDNCRWGRNGVDSKYFDICYPEKIIFKRVYPKKI